MCSCQKKKNLNANRSEGKFRDITPLNCFFLSHIYIIKR